MASNSSSVEIVKIDVILEKETSEAFLFIHDEDVPAVWIAKESVEAYDPELGELKINERLAINKGMI
jgi:hypothetical protein